MIDVKLLGQGGMYPLPDRYLTSLMIRHNGEYILIDCGEGTQVAIREAGWGFRHISTICITHFHGDHVIGIPGLLMTIGNSDRDQPLTLIGPKGLEEVVRSLLIVAPHIGFPLEFIELSQPFHRLVFSDLIISATFVKHGIPCYGYRIDLPREGKFLPEKAEELKIPLSYWSRLQKGETIEINGREIFPNEVLSNARKGISLSYTTDLRPSGEMVEMIKGSDLFVCEGNYGDPEKQENAIRYGHTMFSEAAQMAKDGNVNELWLTHFSPSLTNPLEYLPLAREIFPNTWVDRRETTLVFKD